MGESEFHPLNCAVLTVSDSRTWETDRSGRLVIERLEEAGHRILDRHIIQDDVDALQERFATWVGDPRVQVVISTGGTGITGRDVTPEAAAAVISKPIEGFGELFRYLSYQEIGSSTIWSRAQAGVGGGTLLFNLPGSSGACRLAMDSIILPQLDYRTRPCNLAELLPRLAE